MFVSSKMATNELQLFLHCFLLKLDVIAKEISEKILRKNYFKNYFEIPQIF